MSRPGVFIATLALAAGCGKDPILAAAERDQAARGGGEVGAQPASGDGGPAEERGAADEDDVVLAEGTARRIPSRYFPDGTAGTEGGSPGTPVGLTPGAPVPPAPGEAGTPAPGTPGTPAPGVASATSAGIPSAPTPGRPSEPAPGRPTEPAPGGVGAPGAPLGPTVRVAGTVVFAGWTKGRVRITAFDSDHQAHPVTPPQVVGAVTIDRPGAYELLVPAGKGKIYVEATVDEDGDGRPGRLEPAGTPSRYPVTIGESAVTGLDIDVARVAPPPGSGG